MELKRHGVQGLSSTITTAESLIKFKKESLNGENKKTSAVAKMGETRISLLGGTTHSHPRTKRKVRKMRLPRRSYPSYAMVHMGPLSVQSGTRLSFL